MCAATIFFSSQLHGCALLKDDVQSTIKISYKKKRGAAKCKKMFLDPNNQTIEFKEEGLAIRANAGKFIHSLV
ncbi:hypothetical protein Hanom_Chr02g00146751 [Helianthus anomalus]